MPSLVGSEMCIRDRSSIFTPFGSLQFSSAKRAHRPDPEVLRATYITAPPAAPRLGAPFTVVWHIAVGRYRRGSTTRASNLSPLTPVLSTRYIGSTKKARQGNRRKILGTAPKSFPWGVRVRISGTATAVCSRSSVSSVRAFVPVTEGGGSWAEATNRGSKARQ